MREHVVGSARLELIEGVDYLHVEDAVASAMLSGWKNQQLGGRQLSVRTVEGRAAVVRQFQSYTNEYPWLWSAGDFDEWMTHLTSVSGLAKSSIRSYQGAIRLFCEYITSPAYEWPTVCLQLFKDHPSQICHAWNSVSHLLDYEGGPGRRPFSLDELQTFFDYADNQVEVLVRTGKKGALSAYRDATFFKVLYAWGLRMNEARMLDTVDLHSNAAQPHLGTYGMLHVRHAKSPRGTVPKRRQVLTVMTWAAEALQDYVENVRPRFGKVEAASLWPSERGGRVSARTLNGRFAEYRDLLGLDKSLCPHSLRHSYITHLTEGGADNEFIRRQVGHQSSSTTAIYTSVSSDFMNKMLQDAISKNTAGRL